MKKIISCLALLLLCGCLPFKQVDVYPALQYNVTQPVIHQSTTDVTQYDYKAGAPNDYSSAGAENTTPSYNPYLDREGYPSIESYFKPLKPSVPTTYWPPLMYNFYVQPVVTPVVFWTGNINVKVVE